MLVHLLKKQNKNSLECLKEILISDYKLSNINFIKNEYGKPYLPNNEVCFNISDSGDCIAIAISHSEVGVDIELIKERKRIDKIVSKTFKVSEQVEYNSSSNKIDYFYSIWTKKEAYVKMTGTGIVGYFNNLEDNYKDYVVTMKEKINDDNYYLSVSCLNKEERENIKIIYE